MFDTKNLIEVTGCFPSRTINDGDKTTQLYLVHRCINGYSIDPEYTIHPVQTGFYYPRPFTKKMTVINYKGEKEEKRITIARIGDRYEFPL